MDYFVFPGGVDEGESPEQAAIREAMEELGIQVAIKQKIVAPIESLLRNQLESNRR